MAASAVPGLIDYLTTAVLVLERGSVIEQMNSAAETLLDTSMQAARGARLSELVTGGELLEAIDRMLDTGAPLTERDLSIALSTDRTRVVDCTLTPIAAAGTPKILVEMVQLDRHHQITREADRLTNLVNRMLGPRRPPRMGPVNIHEVTERVRALVSAETPASIVVDRDYDPSIPKLTADPELLIQAMLNIARNAVHALAERGHIVLRTRVQRRVSIGAKQHRLMCRIDVAGMAGFPVQSAPAGTAAGLRLPGSRAPAVAATIAALPSQTYSRSKLPLVSKTQPASTTVRPATPSASTNFAP